MSRITEGEARGLLDAYRSIYEGYGEKKEKEKNCVDKEDKGEHNCAKKVCHEEFGEGICVYGQHAVPDRYGFVSHYDVQFSHGIEKGVPVSEMKVLEEGSHNEENHWYADGEQIQEFIMTGMDGKPLPKPTAADKNKAAFAAKADAYKAKGGSDYAAYLAGGGDKGKREMQAGRAGTIAPQDIERQGRSALAAKSAKDKLASASQEDKNKAAENIFKLKPGSLTKPTNKSTSSTGSGSPLPPAAKTAPTGGTVLAKQQGVTGTLDKATGKFTAKNWSDTETQRYQAKAAQNAPRPGTKAAGPESIKPKTPNPLMKDMPGQNKAELEQMRGNAALQSISQSPRAKQILSGTAKSSAANEIGKASLNRSAAALEAPAPSAKTTPTSSSGSALGSAANPAVRQQLNLPIKAATPTQATAAAPSTSAPASGDLSKTTADIAKKTTQPPVAPTAMKEGVDAYDLVLDYLLENGHADTVDEAHYVMLEMDSKTIRSIAEAQGEWFRGVFNPKNSVAARAQNTSPFATQPKPLPSGTSPFAKPASRGDSGRLTTYGAGGGAAAERSGQTRAQVMQQGAKNLENKKPKPVNQGPDFGR